MFVRVGAFREKELDKFWKCNVFTRLDFRLGCLGTVSFDDMSTISSLKKTKDDNEVESLMLKNDLNNETFCNILSRLTSSIPFIYLKDITREM